jgi:MFS family permease
MRRPEVPASGARLVVLLVVGQLGLHASMAGVRMAASLQVLRDGLSPGYVGVLLALFAAAPVLVALPAGRMTDRRGYHPVVNAAVLLGMGGSAVALASTYLDGAWHFALLCVAAMAVGTAANVGVLAVQRTAGASARSDVERVRVFSWLGVAPPLANVIGPVAVGFAIDLAGFAWGYALMLALPIATWITARHIPRQVPAQPATNAGQDTAWTLLSLPGVKRLFVVNWLFSSCWDVHTIAVPLLGHEKGFDASTIGLILGTFTATVALVRLVAVPLLAHRLTAAGVMRASMLGTALVFAAYPLSPSAATMLALAALLGITLGSVQPMVLTMLHQVTPDARHGEAMALRTMVINATGTVMPLVFGLTGAVAGAGPLFWAVAALVAAGSWLPSRVRPGSSG